MWNALRNLALALVALYFALYVWPTPYKEYQPPANLRDEMIKIRINRVTGSEQYLDLGGWKPLSNKREPPEADTSAPKETFSPDNPFAPKATPDALDKALAEIRAGRK